MKTHKFARKPFYVDAVRVSEANIHEVAQWCDGEVLTDESEGAYIKVRVHRPLTERQTKAFVGDWVLFAGSGYKVYTPKAFDKSFEKVKTLSKAQADEAGIKVPHEPSVKPSGMARVVKATQKGTDRTVTFDPDEQPPVVEEPVVEVVQTNTKPKDEADRLIDEVLKQTPRG